MVLLRQAYTLNLQTLMKLLLQFLLLAGLFSGTYWGLSQVDWVRILHVEQAGKRSEEKLGDLIWKNISATEEVVGDQRITRPVDSMVSLLCRANKIERKIKVHVVRSADINAFALPGNHLVVLTELIRECDEENELLGVLGHEIAHLEQKHVMKKLTREIGLSVLLSAGSGGNNPAVIRQAVKILTSTAYDRRLESRADMASVDYLLKAGADPAGFARFLDKIALLQQEEASYGDWLSTHPESGSRAEAIRARLGKEMRPAGRLFSKDYWQSFKDAADALEAPAPAAGE